MKPIKKILIANRGEIAVRIHSSCREMGIKTVMIYTEKEADFPHAIIGDENICLGTGTLKDTYLNQSKIISIAREHQVDAIHPGYGLLSENASFANSVESAGLIFIGPTSDAMDLMGNKKASKQSMEKLGIPLVPGYHGSSQDPAFLKKEAMKIGLPILIKASAGGGGKGMRIVGSEADFIAELEAAKREAMNAFGDDDVLLEKFIQNPRHIEVQVFSDTHQGHYHLFERECSIQRRHQKIIEETPSPALDSEMREKLCQTAVEITRGINYRGAGTIEYIYDDSGSEGPQFYFLEMNTRLQVEHPVTEMVTGLDLVRLQIQVAQGEKLPFEQKDIKQRGHALEVRIYGEDPDNGFLPAIGKLHYLGATTMQGVRFDSGYSDGNEVFMDFDPMLAKLITYGASRNDAIAKMQKALEDYPFLGVKTNRDYLLRVLKLQAFSDGKTYTHFVETYKDLLQKPVVSLKEKAKMIAAYMLIKRNLNNREVTTSGVSRGPWSDSSSFRNV